MHELGKLRDQRQFDLSPQAPTRLAMIHRSFRTVSMRRGISRQQFAAHFPALGLLNLAHSLRVDAASGKLFLPEIKYFDEEVYTGEDELVKAVTHWLGNSPRRIIAASAYTSTIDYLETFLSYFDTCRYLIIVGGAHATLAPDIENAHIVVRGEGGAAIRHILTKLFTSEFGKGPDAAGICYCLDGQMVNQKQAFDRSLEVLPSPAFAYDLLSNKGQEGPVYATNFTRMLGQRPQIYICTQSCKARCSFCSTYLIHGKAVARPIELIRDDLEYLIHGQGYDSLEFHDDDLLQHPNFFELLRLLKKLGIPWFCYARVDMITHEVAKMMADAGCRRVFIGIESMHQVNLDYYNKKTSVERNGQAVEALAHAGIGAVAGFIIGAPHDTLESILQDLDNFLELPLFAINCSILSPDPGTVEFYRARKRGGDFIAALGGENRIRLIPDTKKYGIETPVGLPSVCEAVSKIDLNNLLSLIDAEFYFRPQIWKGLTNGRTVKQVNLIRLYYLYLLKSLEKLNPDKTHRAIIEQANDLRGRFQTKFWQEQVFGNLSLGITHIEGIKQ